MRRGLLVLALLAATATVTAGHVPTYYLAIGPGEDWQALALATPVDCIRVSLTWNWTQPLRATDLVGVWLVGRSPSGTIREAVSGVVWGEPDRGVRATLTTDSGTLASVGPVGNFVADVTGGRGTFGRICAGAPVKWERVGLAAPNALDATLKLETVAPTTLSGTQTGGTGAYAHGDADFTGLRADVAVTAFAGASVARDVRLVKTLPEGTVNAFVSTDQLAILEAFPGTSPTQSPPPSNAAFGDNIAACTGAFALPIAFCQRLAGPGPWSALGFGDDDRAPAGTYTFRINDEAAAEPVHVALVGAPVDWY